MQAIDPAVLAAAQASPQKVNADKLAELRAMVSKVRDLEAAKNDLETRLKETNIELQEYYFKSLPDLMDQARVPEITIAAEGNYPAVKATALAFYRANIPADWPAEKRAEAFAYLDERGDGDLIKTAVTVQYSREERAEAQQFAAELRRQGLQPTLEENVHWATLTSWLKETVEKHSEIPDLEKIGGMVGRQVRLRDAT